MNMDQKTLQQIAKAVAVEMEPRMKQIAKAVVAEMEPKMQQIAVAISNEIEKKLDVRFIKIEQRLDVLEAMMKECIEKWQDHEWKMNKIPEIKENLAALTKRVTRLEARSAKN